MGRRDRHVRQMHNFNCGREKGKEDNILFANQIAKEKRSHYWSEFGNQLHRCWQSMQRQETAERGRDPTTSRWEEELTATRKMGFCNFFLTLPVGKRRQPGGRWRALNDETCTQHARTHTHTRHTWLVLKQSTLHWACVTRGNNP